jgi:hypothetical protein
MHTDRIWIVLLILAAILIGSNLLMFAMARGLRGTHIDFGKSFRDFTQPWKKEDEGLAELNQRIKDLKPKPDDDKVP